MKRSEAIKAIEQSHDYLQNLGHEEEDNICTALDLSIKSFREKIDIYIRRYQQVLTNHESLDAGVLKEIAGIAIALNTILMRSTDIADKQFNSEEDRSSSYNDVEAEWYTQMDHFDIYWKQVVVHTGNILDGSLLFFDDEEDSLEDERIQMRKEIDELRTAKNNLEEIMEKQKHRYEDVFATQELVIQRDLFKETAHNYEKKSYYWIGGIVASTIAFVALIIFIKTNFCFDLSCFNVQTLATYKPICEDCGKQLLWLEMFKAVFFRFILISLNIYLISFCVKNYNASMHNKVINETRQNTFNVALHFYNTTVGEGKEDVLRRASESLFSHRNTGYNGKHSEPSTPSFVQNIIDKVNPTK